MKSKMIKQIATAIAFTTMTLGASAQASTPRECAGALQDATELAIIAMTNGDVNSWIRNLLLEGYETDHISDLAELSQLVVNMLDAGYTAEEINEIWMGACVQ